MLCFWFHFKFVLSYYYYKLFLWCDCNELPEIFLRIFPVTITNSTLRSLQKKTYFLNVNSYNSLM